ncbi:MAG: FecR domain-containing protein, partial [Rhodospirillales bacterium]|nr:FecR domain-containing protein [Rhodospirillales bacterium]
MALRDNTTHANRSETAIEGATPKIIQVTGGRAVLPDAAFLTTAEYKRLGADLLLEDNQGARVLVQDYFDSDVPADLISSDGAAIPGDLAVRLAGTLAPGQYAQAGRSASAGQPIGNVETVSGQVQVTHADGSKALLTKGAAVFQGDVLQTPQGASVGILFVDKTSLSLGANGRMVLDQLVFDPSAQTGKSAFSLVSGTFSFVSGQIAKSEPDAMVVRTPVATMGIRGTLGTGGYSAQTGLTAAILPEGGQTVGELSITNGSGTQV